jgi:hypothetical protein
MAVPAQTQDIARQPRRSAVISPPPDIPARYQVQTAALCAARLRIVRSIVDEILFLRLPFVRSFRRIESSCPRSHHKKNPTVSNYRHRGVKSFSMVSTIRWGHCRKGKDRQASPLQSLRRAKVPPLRRTLAQWPDAAGALTCARKLKVISFQHVSD